MFTGLYARLISLGVILAILVGAYTYVSHLQTLNTKLTAQNIVLTTKINGQNAAIEQLGKDSIAQIEAGKIEIAAAIAQASKNKAVAQIIYKSAPSTPSDLCKSSLDLINGVTR